MNTTFEVITYMWNSGDMLLTCRGTTLEEAEERAAYLGYVPACWYRPTTWFNRRILIGRVNSGN